MLFKTRGIVLHYIKYSDTSVIATIYTELFGRQSYIINGVRSKKSKIKANILQALYLLDMEVYYKQKADLQRVKEIQASYIFSSLPYDLKKSSIALFIAEVLYKTIQEHEPNKELFEYIFNSIQLLDIKQEGLSNFHIYFLTQLTKYLGFYPNNNYSGNNCYFDLHAGCFVQLKPLHKYFMDKSLSNIFSHMLSYSDNQLENLTIEYHDRITLIEKVLEYYTLHNINITNIKSFNIFKDVFH